MTLLPALAAAFAAFCIWLTVRIVNRRERWAKWMAVGVVVPAAYVLAYARIVHTLEFIKFDSIGAQSGTVIAEYYVPLTTGYEREAHDTMEKVFRPVHWADRKIRREKWAEWRREKSPASKIKQ